MSLVQFFALAIKNKTNAMFILLSTRLHNMIPSLSNEPVPVHLTFDKPRTSISRRCISCITFFEVDIFDIECEHFT